MHDLRGAAISSGNRLLAGLPRSDRDLIQADLSRSRLVAGQILMERGQMSEEAYFVEDGVVSFMAGAEMEGGSVQVAMIGREGIVAGCELLGDAAASTEVVVHIPGPSLRISLKVLQQRMQESPTLRQACMDAVQEWIQQIMMNASAGVHLSLGERCARWLLMVHDRIEGDDLSVTHEGVSDMLGARRSGVSHAIAGFQGKGLVRIRRGGIRILDRPGLESIVRGAAGRRSGRQRLDGASAPARQS